MKKLVSTSMACNPITAESFGKGKVLAKIDAVNKIIKASTRKRFQTALKVGAVKVASTVAFEVDRTVAKTTVATAYVASATPIRKPGHTVQKRDSLKSALSSAPHICKDCRAYIPAPGSKLIRDHQMVTHYTTKYGVKTLTTWTPEEEAILVADWRKYIPVVLAKKMTLGQMYAVISDDIEAYNASMGRYLPKRSKGSVKEKAWREYCRLSALALGTKHDMKKVVL